MPFFFICLHEQSQFKTNLNNNCINEYGLQNVKDDLQKQLESPMTWIDMYIAAASAGCTLAMVSDVFNGFRKKKLWFPCKYFSLNDFSLTALAVAMKLTVDLTTLMEGVNEMIAQTSSLVLMSTVMANFMVSLGSMRNNDVMVNLAALGILVITIVGNVNIRLFNTHTYYNLPFLLTGYEGPRSLECAVSLLLFLGILCSCSVMIPTAKAYIESQYNQIHKWISNERLDLIGELTALRVAVKRYWVMSETGAPQFVIARSVMGVTSGIMCFSMAITLLVSDIRIYWLNGSPFHIPPSSSYMWSIKWILIIQSTGVVVGTIPPLLRWFTAAKLKSTKLDHKSCKDEFMIEAYWTQRLKDWRDNPLPFQNGHLRFRKKLHDAKRLLLNFCIVVQILIVWASKLLLLGSSVFIRGVLCCFSHIKDIVRTCYSGEPSRESGKSNDLNDYMMLLQGESELPEKTLKNICNEVDKLIQMGKKKQPKNLVKHLLKSVNFNWVREFDSREIQNIHSQEWPKGMDRNRLLEGCLVERAEPYTLRAHKHQC